LWLHNINISQRKGKYAFNFIYKAIIRQKLKRFRSLSSVKMSMAAVSGPEFMQGAESG
jgi:hypothetical protein